MTKIFFLILKTACIILKNSASLLTVIEIIILLNLKNILNTGQIFESKNDIGCYKIQFGEPSAVNNGIFPIIIVI